MLSNRAIRWAAATGIAAQVLFFLSWFVASWFEVGSYSQWRDYTSDLGSLTAAHPLPYNIGVSVSGLLTVPLAIALSCVFWGSLSGRVGAALIAVFAVGQFIDGLLREDCSPRQQACKALGESPGFSWHHYGHDIESVFTFLGILVAPFLLSRAFAASAHWRPFAGPSKVLALVNVVVLAGFLAAGFQSSQPGAGFLERVFLTTSTTWLAIVAWWLLRFPERNPA